MRSALQQLHILVVSGPGPAGPDLHDWLGEHGWVETVDSPEAALNALRREEFDVVVTRSADFSAMARAEIAEEVLGRLDLGEYGLCLTSPEGDVVWANPVMLGLPRDVRERVDDMCRQTIEWATRSSVPQPEHLRGRSAAFTTEQDNTYEITVTPIVDQETRRVQAAGLVWDVTQQCRLRSEIDSVHAVGRELIDLDAEHLASLNAAERLGLLEQRIARFLREFVRCENFAIRLLDKQTHKLELVMCTGLPPAAQNLDVYANAEGNGITGYVACSGRSYLCADAATDPRYLVGMDNARSSLTTPLKLSEQVIGVLNIESAIKGAYGETERRLVETFARYVAIAVHMLDLMITERRAVTGQFAKTLLGDVSGPINDIITDIAGLVDEHLGDDELRGRLVKLSDAAAAVRQALQRAAVPNRGLISERRRGGQRCDPILSGKRVLVADDEEVIRDTVRDVLASYGCDVCIAADGEDAVRLIRERPFDLVLSDIRMPKRNGYEVFSAAKDAKASCPVILMTGFGYDPNHAIIRARREGLAAVLFKPFKVDQLLGEIRAAIRAAAG